MSNYCTQINHILELAYVQFRRSKSKKKCKESVNFKLESWSSVYKTINNSHIIFANLVELEL